MRIHQLAGTELAELWSLRPDSSLREEDPANAPAGPAGEGGRPGPVVVLESCWGSTRIERPGPHFAELLRRMTLGPVSPANVLAPFPPVLCEADAAALAPEVTALRANLASVQNCVVRTLALGGTPLLSVVPIAADARFEPCPPPADRPLRAGDRRLSRFALLHSGEHGLHLESPLSQHRVEVHHPAVGWVLGELGGGRDASAAATGRRPLEERAVTLVHAYLEAAGMTTPFDGTAYAEDSDPALTGWTPADLFLHARSRPGRTDADLGMTYPLAGRAPAQPPVKTPDGRAPVLLERPCLTRLRTDDPPFTEVLEERRSTRSFAAQDPSLGQLGELLYRAARVRAVLPPHAGDPTRSWRTRRPYPSAGSSYGLEIYVVAVRCSGLPPGAYHYDPLEHRLEPVHGDPQALADILADARSLAGMDERPPLLVVLTSRLLRVATQFSSVAYASVLKEVGALQQTFYLVCAAMGMGACALTAGDVGAVARALGVDWLAEPSVGEIVFGLPRTVDASKESNIPPIPGSN
ncbi:MULTISPECIES: SagB family peptide dehydrogenase [Streptomyces]|uniref:SagB/ThcOx family dehydrogenase n=1 Tax=Streptomyces TaxID=1883 RepID=UPI00207ADA4C|nr:SagB family peptide dehydrogenase [Streptomyces spororaveus]MCM9082427.1 SagB family peptide dehydrogenase [Streptomyces spororaveus]